MPRSLPGALAALLVSLVLVAPARAVPDGPLDVDLAHQEPLARGRMHLGVDVGILTALDVRAATSGTVTASGWITGYEGYGNVVMVDGGRGYSVLYAHLSEAHVVPGRWVDEGDPIGLAGCTGSCTGTHLHFELREHDVPIDSFPYLKGTKSPPIE